MYQQTHIYVVQNYITNAPTCFGAFRTIFRELWYCVC